jgi:hypothetical protein
MLILGAAPTAQAQTCSTYPNSLTNGTTADANQVMANFGCAALLGAAHFTGNVGIGTSNPSAPLTVVGVNNYAPTVLITIPSESAGGLNLASSSGGWLTLIPNTGAGDFNPIVQSGDALITFTNGSMGAGALSLAPWSNTTSGIRMTPGGNVGIGTATPISLLYVNGSAGGPQAWSSPSDARLKTNVRTIPDALARVIKLRGVSFDWKPAETRKIQKDLALPIGERQLGFIAQEVAVVTPEAITRPKDPNDIYTLRSTDLIPLLVEAIKTQQAEIKSLGSEVGELKARIAELGTQKALSGALR